MHRTEGEYNNNNLFTDGPPGTRVEEGWLNALQNEIVNVIEDAGITLKTAGTETGTQLLEALRGGSFFPNHAAIDQGATGNSDTIKYAIDTIGSDNGTIYLRHNSGSATTTYTLTTSETAETNIRFIIEKGAILDGAGTLTVNGPIEAGLYKIFGTSVTIVWGGGYIKEVYPQWWGALADNVTDDSAAIQACIDSVIAVTADTRPVIKLIGRFSHASSLETRTAAQNTIRGITISGQMGGRAGDAGSFDGLTTLTYTGNATGFYFGRVDTIGFRPWMLSSILENIQFVGNNTADVGLEIGANNCVIRNIHVTGNTQVGGIGIRATGEVNSYYDVSATGNYDGISTLQGGHASKASNTNNYYSCVWNGNTRYGYLAVGEHGASYFANLWQSNESDGYHHTAAGTPTNFFGGWFENNNTTTDGHQLLFAGTTPGNRASGLNILGTLINAAGGAATTGLISIENTDNTKLFPAWVNAGPTHQFTNGGGNLGMDTNSPSVAGAEGAPSFHPRRRNITGADGRAEWVLEDADLSFDAGQGFRAGFRTIPQDTGTAYEVLTSNKALPSNGATTDVFRLTLADSHTSLYFTLRATGMSLGGLWLRLKAERWVKYPTVSYAIATIGTDDLDATGGGGAVPALVVTGNTDGTIDIGITNNLAAGTTTYGHLVLEIFGGSADSASTTLDRGFTVEEL